MNEELYIHEGTILHMISEGYTYQQISDYLVGVTGESTGLSPRSLRRFCASRNIGPRGLEDAILQHIVCSAISSVGHSYGRRTMHGMLASRGIHVSQSRLAAAMQIIAPIQYAARRRNIQRMVNPFPYHASYYGEKIHLDQNEKCVMFGVTHVVAIDGYSRKIVGFITIPKKNPIVIYNVLFRPLLETEGIWEQVRVDHGTEFTLVATAQEHLAHFRQSHHHQPILQSTSRHNHRAERIWPEVNQRINYPVKRVLVDMENNEDIHMSNEVTKFCVSWVTIHVMQDAINTFVQSWNNHRIPGGRGGIPLNLASRANRVTPLHATSIPSTTAIIQLHEQSGTRLRRDATYGSDPLDGNTQLQELRKRDFLMRFPDFRLIFQDIIHNNGFLFRLSIKHFIELTNNFAALL